MSHKSNEFDGTVIAVCTSEKTGMKKQKVPEGCLVRNFGLKDDAHADSKTHRQVSLLAIESIMKMQKMGLKVSEGDFAENITTKGIDLLLLPVGSKIEVGKEAILEITQHGKKCHSRCEIYREAGTCIMPTEGIFAKVIQGGIIKKGDGINKMKYAI